MVDKTNVFRKLAGCSSALALMANVFSAPLTNSSEKPSLSIEERLELLQNEINQLKEWQAKQQTENMRLRNELEGYQQQTVTAVAKLENAVVHSTPAAKKLHIGGYGELKANFIQGSDRDIFDINRVVLNVDYEFSDWIKFFSEWEVEHALVQDSATGSNGGYLLIEQAHFDFLLSEKINIRAGRFLTPVGIINKTHEPETYFGVNRPSVERIIIPTTWPADGIGLFGNLSPRLTYEAYVAAGMNGARFNALDGIRPGRLRERPSLNDVAFTGRLDYYLDMPEGQDLRLGVSGFWGGLNNGNRGANPGIDGNMRLLSADFDYSIDKWDFRGVLAHNRVSGARAIGGGVAEEMFGWYLQGGYHFWPEAFKTGKMADSDAVVFVRYDKFNTQHKMPSGTAANPAGDRNEWTLGLNFYLTPSVVVKTDYQIQQDNNDGKLDRLNLGLGWSF